MRPTRVGLGKHPWLFLPAVPRAAGQPCDAPPPSPALQLVEEGQGEVLMEADRMEPLRSGKSHLHFSPFTRINVRSKAHNGMARRGASGSGSGSGSRGAPPGRGIGNLASLRQQLAEKEMEAARAAEEQRRQERARQRQQRQLQALEQQAQQAQQQPDRQQQRQQRQQQRQQLEG